MTAAGERVFRELRDALSPSVLREEIVLRLERAREAFVPPGLVPGLWEEFVGELVRFVGHMSQQQYAPTGLAAWPSFVAQHDTDALLARHYGTAVQGARALHHLASAQGMRAVFDTLTRHLEEDRLRTYLDARLLLPIQRLPVEDWLPFATAYLAEFRALPHVPTEHPAFLVGRWPELLAQHARLVLGWA